MHLGAIIISAKGEEGFRITSPPPSVVGLRLKLDQSLLWQKLFCGAEQHQHVTLFMQRFCHVWLCLSKYWGNHCQHALRTTFCKRASLQFQSVFLQNWCQAPPMVIRVNKGRRKHSIWFIYFALLNLIYPQPMDRSGLKFRMGVVGLFWFGPILRFCGRVRGQAEQC